MIPWCIPDIRHLSPAALMKNSCRYFYIGTCIPMVISPLGHATYHILALEPDGSDEENSWIVFFLFFCISMVQTQDTLAWSHLRTWGHIWTKSGKGPLGHVTWQIYSNYATVAQISVFFNILMYLEWLMFFIMVCLGHGSAWRSHLLRNGMHHKGFRQIYYYIN